MAVKVSQLVNGGIRYGKDLKTSTSTVEPGLLVKLDSSGSTASESGSTVATKPFGIAYGGRYEVYRPLTRVFDLGEHLVAVWGQGMFLLSVDFFDGATLPTAGAALYSQTGGLWTTNAASANKVGDAIGTRTRIEPVAGTGSPQSLALVRFNIIP